MQPVKDGKTCLIPAVRRYLAVFSYFKAGLPAHCFWLLIAFALLHMIS